MSRPAGQRRGREGRYVRWDLVDVELDAVAGEDERLAVERHRHPVAEQLRVLRHIFPPLRALGSSAWPNRRRRLANQQRTGRQEASIPRLCFQRSGRLTTRAKD
jgi:hypothetical protein